MTKNAEAFAARMLDAVKGYVSHAAGALSKRLDELETRLKSIPLGPKGEPGKDADPAYIDAAVQKAVASLPAPKNGEDGKPGKSAYSLAVERGFSGTELQWLDSLKGATGNDGKDADSIAIKRAIYEDVEKALPAAAERAVAASLPTIVKLAADAVPRPLDGKDGLPGKDGKNGLSAYELAKDLTEVEDYEAHAKWLASLKGANGAPGKDGRNGIDGKDGSNGVDGKDGAPGLNGKDATVDEEAIVERVLSLVPAPKDGLNGKDGESVHRDTVALLVREEVEAAVSKIAPAKDGKDGANGRDALELNPLSSIDETKSYPAGTWAKYCGGLIRSERKTDPITGSLADAGWSVIVEGISAIVVTQAENLRSFSVAAMLTSGTKAVSDFTVPMILQKGVYRSGATYETGDVVTYGGSQWVALKETKTKPPSDDWQLCVQRGRDGKDAE